MSDTRELLENISQLTLIREEQALVDAYFEFMLAQFGQLQAIVRYKLEQLSKDASLTLEAFQSKAEVGGELVHSDEFNKALSDLIPQYLRQYSEGEDRIETIAGYSLLIKKSNREKAAMFFLVYLFSKTTLCDSQSGFIPGTLLKTGQEPEQLQIISYLSDIYSNHQTMITLNDKDSLTGLYNRKSFDRSMKHFFEGNIHQHRRSSEGHNIACLALLDIDHFKHINDEYGHLYGDEVLLLFAQQMQLTFREDDMLFRYGGEEFVVILKDISSDIAETVLHRFRQHIESFAFPQIDQVTVSIGFTQLDPEQMQSDIFSRADQALYYIKEHGRNNVASYENLLRDGFIQQTVAKDDIELF